MPGVFLPSYSFLFRCINLFCDLLQHTCLYSSLYFVIQTLLKVLYPSFSLPSFILYSPTPLMLPIGLYFLIEVQKIPILTFLIFPNTTLFTLLHTDFYLCFNDNHMTTLYFQTSSPLLLLGFKFHTHR